MAVALVVRMSVLVLVIAVAATALVTATITVAIMRSRRPRISIVEHLPVVRSVPILPSFCRAGTQPGTGLQVVRPGEVSSYPIASYPMQSGYAPPMPNEPATLPAQVPLLRPSAPPYHEAATVPAQVPLLRPSAPAIQAERVPLPDETPTVPAPSGWPAMVLEAKTVPSTAIVDRSAEEAPTVRAPPGSMPPANARARSPQPSPPPPTPSVAPAAHPSRARSSRPPASPSGAQAQAPTRTRSPRSSPAPVGGSAASTPWSTPSPIPWPTPSVPTPTPVHGSPWAVAPTRRDPSPPEDDGIDAPTVQDQPRFHLAPAGVPAQPLVRIPDSSTALAPASRAESPRWETGEYTSPDELVAIDRSGGDFRVPALNGVGDLDLEPRDPEIEVASMRNALNDLSLEDQPHDPPTGLIATDRRSRT